MPRQKTKLNLKSSIYTVLLIGTANIALADNVSSTPVANNVPANSSSVNLNTASNNNVSRSAQSSTDTSDADFNRFFINGSFGAAGVSNGSGGGAIGPAYSLNAGFNFNKTFAVEAGYTGMAGLNVAAIPDAIFGYYGSPGLNYNIFDVAFRSTLHLSKYFSFYGKLGGAIENATWSGSYTSSYYSVPDVAPGPNTTSFGALLGGGASVDLGSIGLFFELDQFLAITGQNSATPSNYTSGLFGIQYNF